MVISGWSEHPIDADLSGALIALVAQTAASIEAAGLVSRLRDLAASDPLTGIANRRFFDETLEQAVAGHGVVGVALIDMDGFKQINDTHGHLVGDQTLIATAERVTAAVGSAGVVARFGGDEIVVLLARHHGGPGQRARPAARRGDPRARSRRRRRHQPERVDRGRRCGCAV